MKRGFYFRIPWACKGCKGYGTDACKSCQCYTCGNSCKGCPKAEGVK